MDAIQLLQADLAKELKTAREVADKADEEGRGLTKEERDTAETALARVTELKTRIGDEKEKDSLRGLVDGFDKLQAEGVLDTNPVREPAEMSRAKSMGEALVASEGFRTLAAKFKDSGKMPEKFSTPSVEVPWARMKTAGDPSLESANTELFGTGGGAGALSTLFPLETPGFVQQPLTIAALIPSVPITVGNSASYPVVKTRTDIAGTPQTEGSAKPAGLYEFDVETAALITLAGWIKVSTQFLEDAPGLAAYINADLPFQVRQNEEAYLATGLYTAATHSEDGTGIGGSNDYDAVLDAITTCRNNGFQANTMIIDPVDWATLRVTKLLDGDGGYVGGGPMTPTNNPWGLDNVVITASASDGIPLVGDFNRGAKVFRRGGMSVRTSDSDGTDFQKNVITVLAEERLVLGVTYPEAFCEVEMAS